MSLNIYNTKNDNIYAIHVDNKIYNLVLDFKNDDELNSYLKGGIIQFNKPITDLYNPKWFIKYPNNLLIKDDTNYKLKKVENILYDSNVWTFIDNNRFKYKNSNLELDISNITINNNQESNITDEIESKIKEILIDVEKIKKLYNNDDDIFNNQWFMGYVNSLNNENNNDENREKNISTYLANIHQLSKDFQINNNHQMKLFFKIFFNLED